MQGHYNEHCLGLGRQALILHGSHRELEPFKPAEDPCYHSPSEVLALPQLLKRTPQFFSQTFPSCQSKSGFPESPNKISYHSICPLKMSLPQYSFLETRFLWFLKSSLHTSRFLAVGLTAEPSETNLAWIASFSLTEEVTQHRDNCVFMSPFLQGSWVQWSALLFCNSVYKKCWTVVGLLLCCKRQYEVSGLNKMEDSHLKNDI